MKIRCECGSSIVDQTDYLPYKGYIIPDEELFYILETIDNAIENPGITMFEREKSLMLIRTLIGKITIGIWQCNDCGALYINDKKGLSYFSPVYGEIMGILRSRTNKEEKQHIEEDIKKIQPKADNIRKKANKPWWKFWQQDK